MLRLAFVFILAFLVGIVIQALFVHALFPAAVAPDFTLILIVYLGLFHRTPLGALGAFLLGLSADFASGQFAGPYAAGAVVAFALVVSLSQRVYAEKGLAIVIMTVIASVAKSLVYGIMLMLYVESDLFRMQVLKVILLEALLSGIVAPLFLSIVDWCKRPRESRRKTGTVGKVRWSH